MTLRSISLLALLSATAIGCSVPTDTNDSETEFEAEASANEISVRQDGLTVWVRTVVGRKPNGAGLVASIEGRTSRNLDEVFSWVPDDPFGRATKLSARRFRIDLDGGHELNSILSGLPIHVRLVSGARTWNAAIDVGARFVRFTGDASIRIDAPIAPVYVRGDANPLRYRGGVATAGGTSLTVTTSTGATAAIARTSQGRFDFDFTYPDFEKALAARTVDLHVRGPAYDARKSAAIELQATALRVTGGDPETAWPMRTCDKSVWSCFQKAADPSTCGTYREVAVCSWTDECEFAEGGTLPFALQSREAASLVRAASAADAACPKTGGSWCSVGAAKAFTFPYCVAKEPTLEEVAAAALNEDERHSYDGRFFTRLDRATLASNTIFSTGLLAAIDAHAGDVTFEAVRYDDPQPCHNCTQFGQKYVLYYPATRVVVVIDSSFGYDS
jgi:hypothetical protein